MQKLIPVEGAKTLMREDADWSVWSWISQKAKLRKAADAAWEAQEEQERKVKQRWSDELNNAYHGKGANHLERDVRLAVDRVREADEEWKAARVTAEATFDEADRRMSTTTACEGAQQAIKAWELTEKAIRRAEAVARRIES